VDAEIALASIDRILRQQQLNFVLLGSLPSLLLLYLLISWLRALEDDESFAGEREGRALLRTALRESEILLNRLDGAAGITFRDSGMLRIQARLLLLSASVIPGDQRAEFLEDIAELEDGGLGAAQKLRVLSRMRWSYKGVFER
jgi:nuclear-control-of-ATPase protein 2